MVFPLLIRRLIVETAGHALRDIDIPGESGTAVGGFDGIVTTTAETPFVPFGTSVWELSVETKAQAKANDDYSKRLAPPEGEDMSNVAYVEAILSAWTQARTWARDKTAERRWREVRGYNLDRIHLWLDSAPATTIWLANKLGKNPPGVESLQDWWSNTWLTSTEVPLDRPIVLAGRETAAEKFCAEIASGKRVIALGGDLRPDDARAFVSAALASSDSTTARLANARALFVWNAETLHQLIRLNEPMIFLLSDPSLGRELPGDHPHQLVVTATTNTEASVIVPRVHSRLVAAELTTAGLNPDRAVRLGQLAHRSLTALRRSLAKNPVVFTPAWASQPNSLRRRLLLAGMWDNENANDRTFISDIVGIPGAEIEEELPALLAGDDIPFLGKVGSTYHVLAAEDAWTLLAPTLTTDDLDSFESQLIAVLAERDSSLEIGPRSTWRAGANGIARRHSSYLREGLAQSLILLAVTDPVVGAGVQTGSYFVYRAVKRLLELANNDDTKELWFSLTDVLFLLAEASPEAFIEAITTATSPPNPLQESLFAEKEVIGFGLTPLFEVFIAALEMLAWAPDYLDAAAEILALFAESAAGQKNVSRNRPMEALAGVLSTWCPNTNADTQHRIRVIKRVVKRHPAIAHEFLMMLVPNNWALHAVHPRPRFRDWETRGPADRDERADVLNAVLDLLIDGLSYDSPNPYVDLIGKVYELTPTHRTRLAERLTELANACTEPETILAIFERLRDEIARHRAYSDTAWALTEEELTPLVVAYDALTPQEPVSRYAWLFKSLTPELGDSSARGNLAEAQRQVDARRQDAIAEMVSAGGLNAVLDLTQMTGYPDIVGRTLAQHSDTFDTDIIPLLTTEKSALREFASGYVRQRLRDSDDSLLERFLSAAEDTQTKARVLDSLPNPTSAWQWIERLEPEIGDEYWRTFTYLGRGRLESSMQAAWALLDVGRAAAALHVVSLFESTNDTSDAADLIASALEALSENGLQDPEWSRLHPSTIASLFQQLARHRDSVGRERVIQLEWDLFPILGLRADIPALHQYMVEEPAFFVEIVAYAFRPESSVETEFDDESELRLQREKATRAYEVLLSLQRCPGVSADTGELDEATLGAWIYTARSELIASDRKRAGDRMIGHILANAPIPNEETRLSEAVRNILEEIDSDDVDQGLEIAILNERGVTSRDVLEGGDQDRLVAERLRREAAAATSWPRAKRLLDRLASYFERDARRNDLSADHWQSGLGW